MELYENFIKIYFYFMTVFIIIICLLMSYVFFIILKEGPPKKDIGFEKLLNEIKKEWKTLKKYEK